MRPRADHRRRDSRGVVEVVTMAVGMLGVLGGTGMSAVLGTIFLQISTVELRAP